MAQLPTRQDKAKLLAKMEAIRSDYERVFGTPEGKRVLDDLKVSAFFTATSYNSDTHLMAYNEGARTLVLHIENMSTPKPKEPVTGKAIKGD